MCDNKDNKKNIESLKAWGDEDRIFDPRLNFLEKPAAALRTQTVDSIGFLYSLDITGPLRLAQVTSTPLLPQYGAGISTILFAIKGFCSATFLGVFGGRSDVLLYS